MKRKDRIVTTKLKNTANMSTYKKKKKRQNSQCVTIMQPNNIVCYSNAESRNCSKAKIQNNISLDVTETHRKCRELTSTIKRYSRLEKKETVPDRR